MSMPILATKLYIPPTQPGLVLRPRLTNRLNEGMHLKLILISASAGFGKTTLISEWVADCKQPVTWLSLDDEHNDLTRFLVYLVAALQSIAADIGEGVMGMLQSPQQPPIESILTALLNEITTVPDNFTLVLDDYHVIDAKAIDDVINFLLEHLPPQMHLIITTREDPNLHLARLRGRGQLTELRTTDLRFTTSEVTDFMGRITDLSLSEKDIGLLATRTEGWIAGLQLAAISIQGYEDTASFIKNFSGSHRFVLDYLIEEVLQQQSENIQNFLLCTSVLDRMCGPLCDAVLSDPNIFGQETLEYLEQANLFIVPLDNERIWYRYHHLFADLLRQRLFRVQKGQATTLYQRASDWHEQNGFADEAIEYALRGKYFERAACLIDDHFGISLINKYEGGGQTLLRRWLAELPEELIFSKPHLCILHAWNLFTGGQLDEAERSLQTVEKLFDYNADQEYVISVDKDKLSDIDRKKLSGIVAAIRSFLSSYSEDIPGTINYARQALEFLPKQELSWRSIALLALGDAYAGKGQLAEAHKARSDALVAGKASGDTYTLMIVNLRLAGILRQQGKLQQVINICEKQLKSANKCGSSESGIVGWLLGIWGEVLAELNNPDRAIELARKGVELTADSRDVFMISWSKLCLVRVLFSLGDIAGAEDVIQSMENTSYKCKMPQWAFIQFSAWQVRIWLVQGKLDAASQWIEEHELDPDGELTYLHETEYIVFARILIVQGRLNKGAGLLQLLLKSAETDGRIASVIEILILQTLAAQLDGNTDQAMSILEQALTLAEPGGFIRIFVDEGIPMTRLLSEAAARGIMPNYTDKLLAVFEAEEKRITGETPHPAVLSSQSLVEPLSLRELEVLGLLAEGLSNPEICDRLFIALDTVKGHNRKIYGKLGVENRAKAIIKARSLNILPPQ